MQTNYASLRYVSLEHSKNFKRFLLYKIDIFSPKFYETFRKTLEIQTQIMLLYVTFL